MDHLIRRGTHIAFVAGTIHAPWTPDPAQIVIGIACGLIAVLAFRAHPVNRRAELLDEGLHGLEQYPSIQIFNKKITKIFSILKLNIILLI